MSRGDHKILRHSGRAERDLEPRDHRHSVCPWVPGSRFANPGMMSVREGCKSLGAIGVEARLHDFSFFDAAIRFSTDQSYMPPIINSLRSARPVLL